MTGSLHPTLLRKHNNNSNLNRNSNPSSLDYPPWIPDKREFLLFPLTSNVDLSLVQYSLAEHRTNSIKPLSVFDYTLLNCSVVTLVRLSVDGLATVLRLVSFIQTRGLTYN